MSNTIDRENCILASFLYSNDMGMNTEDAFMLDSRIFTSSYRRATADKINEESDGDKYYGYLSVTLRELTSGTSFEQDFIDIESQTPMPFSVAKRMHEKLTTEYKERVAKAFR